MITPDHTNRTLNLSEVEDMLTELFATELAAMAILVFMGLIAFMTVFKTPGRSYRHSQS